MKIIFCGVRGREKERLPYNLKVRDRFLGASVNFRIFISPYIQFPEARSRVISISCKNSFLNRCKINIFNPFPNKPWFLRVCSGSLLKTLWEKEKSLLTSNFSFSHSVFNPFGNLSATFIKFKIVV